MGETTRRKRVAVVGSGLAGLVTGYLLQNDPRNRYSVVIFERGPALSLDAASITLDQGTRVDVPMRAFTAGYYNSLIAMYNHLDIAYHPQKFLLVFPTKRKLGSENVKGELFIHLSDNLERLWTYLVELCLFVAGFIWLTIWCYLVPSRSTETFGEYMQRIWMPRRFTSRYLLPLTSAIATCSHQEISDFPASDIVRYMKLIRGKTPYVVHGGVGLVEQKLAQNSEVRLRNRVVRVEPKTSGVEVLTEKWDENGKGRQVAEHFDQVVLAVPPNVVASVFEPARRQMERIPVRTFVETIVHHVSPEGECETDVDQIVLQTSREDGWTEGTHIQHGSIGVTSCPIAERPEKEILSRSFFTRTLRTLESRQIVEHVFSNMPPGNGGFRDEKPWRNGDDGVWLAGAWCWDGMVLLEGAVVSAERVAKAFGVEVPW